MLLMLLIAFIHLHTFFSLLAAFVIKEWDDEFKGTHRFNHFYYSDIRLLHNDANLDLT